MRPSFDRDPVLKRNDARQLFARARRKSHFRSIVKPQAIHVSLRILVKGGDDAGYGQGLLGFPALVFPLFEAGEDGHHRRRPVSLVARAAGLNLSRRQ